MNALNKLQRAFADDLWGDDLQHMQGLIVDGRLPAKRLMQVYRNNFRSSLTEALAAIYPVLEKLVGADYFTFLADRYLRAYPSRSGNLHQLGEQLAAFLSHFQTAVSLPYLADVARLEWAFHDVFHSAKTNSSALQQLASCSPEQILQARFKLGTSCRLVISDYPIFKIWQTNHPDYSACTRVDLNSGGESVLVVRPQWQVELWRLSIQHASFLHALDQGENLTEAVEKVLAITSDFNLQNVLASFLAAGHLIFVSED
jgi:hypothetical protein